MEKKNVTKRDWSFFVINMATQKYYYITGKRYKGVYNRWAENFAIIYNAIFFRLFFDLETRPTVLRWLRRPRDEGAGIYSAT